MKHRIKLWIGIALLVMGLTATVGAETADQPSVTVSIPVCFSKELPDSVEAIVTLREQSGAVMKTMTRSELKKQGKTAFSLTFTEPGSYAYTITAESNLGEETCNADVAVMSDDAKTLTATLVLYWKDASTKVDEVEFGHWKKENPTPEKPTPEQPTPNSPSTPENPSNQPSTPSGSTPNHPNSPNRILGLTSNDWYGPLLVLAIGIGLVSVAIWEKRRRQE